MAFEDGDASGFDDVFPSMGEPARDGLWPEMPDHGLIWTLPMREERFSGGAASFSGRTEDWFYRKTVRLEGDSVLLEWRIANLSARPRPFVWVCHCLWQLDADTVFRYPPDAGEAADVLAPGEPSRPPVTSPVPDGGMAKTYFRRPVPEGRCGCVWPSRGLEMTMSWDSEKLPYLGFWITNGLWRGDRNFAFEPGSSYYDTLSRALESGTLRILAPEESFTFSIRITVKETR